MTDTVPPRRFLRGEGKTCRIGRMTMTFKTTAAQQAKAIAAKYGLELLG